MTFDKVTFDEVINPRAEKQLKLSVSTCKKIVGKNEELLSTISWKKTLRCFENFPTQ
jgi:hypothetical protein